MFEGHLPSMKVNDLGKLDLPHLWKTAIVGAIKPHLMEYDLWIESGDDTQDLRESLNRQGFRKLPAITQPALWMSTISTGIESKVDFSGRYAPALPAITLKKLRLLQHPSRRNSR